MAVDVVKSVAANGLRFGYLEAGRGPLAFCLHGVPDSAYTWRHLLALGRSSPVPATSCTWSSPRRSAG